LDRWEQQWWWRRWMGMMMRQLSRQNWTDRLTFLFPFSFESVSLKFTQRQYSESHGFHSDSSGMCPFTFGLPLANRDILFPPRTVMVNPLHHHGQSHAVYHKGLRGRLLFCPEYLLSYCMSVDATISRTNWLANGRSE
jgi:hypothetical protein